MALANHVLLIVGATREIGRSIAFNAAEEGASILVADVDPVRGTELQTQLENSGHSAAFVECDPSSEESVQAVVGEAVLSFGNLTSVVICLPAAAVGNATTIDLEQWSQSALNALRGSAWAARFALPFLKTSTRGSILLVLTGADSRAAADSFAQSTINSALAGAVRSMAVDLGRHGVRVNAIVADALEPAMLGRPAEGDAAKAPTVDAAQFVPLGRLGRIDEVARVATFLISDSASFINGTVLPVDGGRSIALGRPTAE